MKDLRGLDASEQRRFDAMRTLAKEYMATKQRQKCYKVKGNDIYSEGERALTFIIPLTDEQVDSIKNQMIEVANKVYADKPVGSWEEFEMEILELGDTDYWDELNITSGPWNDYIVHPLDGNDFAANSIDFDNPTHLYHFSVYVYETDEGQMSGPHSFAKELSDDEYTFLLALQLSVREGFTYNTLFKIDPEFAQKLNRSIDFMFFDIDRWGNKTKPFLITFDEIIKDADILKDEAEKRLLSLIL